MQVVEVRAHLAHLAGEKKNKKTARVALGSLIIKGKVEETNQMVHPFTKARSRLARNQWACKSQCNIDLDLSKGTLGCVSSTALDPRKPAKTRPKVLEMPNKENSTLENLAIRVLAAGLRKALGELMRGVGD